MTDSSDSVSVAQEETDLLVRGSGNVFADLDLPDSDDLFLKAQLALLISRTIQDLRLTQRKAAELTGIPQPDISAIVRGKLVGYSALRLMRALRSLGKGVEVHITGLSGEDDLVLAV
jgi:predicted XRE-type DNA-binding protein